MINITFSKSAWEEYVAWQRDNNKIFVKINELIKDIQRTPFEGKGKPEPLKFDLTGYWSRRIDMEHRLVYQYSEKEILIISCKFHFQ